MQIKLCTLKPKKQKNIDSVQKEAVIEYGESFYYVCKSNDFCDVGLLFDLSEASFDMQRE